MQAARALGSAETVMDQSVFEGMYVRALTLDPDFIAAPAAVGYDPKNPRPRYPGSVWRATLISKRPDGFELEFRAGGERHPSSAQVS